MKIITIIFLALGVVQIAHGENSLNHAKHGHERSGAHEDNKPSLDHGAKWKMDTHTREMFASMTERVHTGGDLKEIGVKLNDDLYKLIQGCTMTGAAHDQLHLFLAPYIPAVRELSQEGSEEALQEVKHTLHDYQAYFE